MPDYHAQCETAILDGRWDAVEPEARAWARNLPEGVEKDPRPHFALNVVHLASHDADFDRMTGILRYSPA